MANRITVTLHELVAGLDGYADELLRAKYGSSFGEFQYLAVLAEQGTIDITTLARCLNLTKAAVSKRVPALVAADLIETSNDPANARRVLLTLTPRAADLVERAGGELDAGFTELLDDEPPVDAEALHQLLRTLLARISEKE